MKVRLQADADLNQIILQATLRREPGLDFKTSQRANLDGLPDFEALAKAAEEGRILVTHDRKTMPKFFAEFVTTRQSPGVLIVPQNLPVHRAAEDLVLIWICTEAEEWVNRIFALPI